jgi:hypothetical protein
LRQARLLGGRRDMGRGPEYQARVLIIARAADGDL